MPTTSRPGFRLAAGAGRSPLERAQPRSLKLGLAHSRGGRLSMRSILSILTFATLVLLAVPATAEECEPTTSEPEVDTGETAIGRYYVDNDDCQDMSNPVSVLPGGGYGGGGGCLFSVWIYQESNGIDGLQRGDEMKDDTCGGEIEMDTLPFY
jgi:hypothetical protein